MACLIVCLPNTLKIYGQILMNFQQILTMKQETADSNSVARIAVWIQEFFKDLFVIASIYTSISRRHTTW